MTVRTFAVAVGVLAVAASCALSVLGSRLWTKPNVGRPGAGAQKQFPLAPNFQLNDISGGLLKLSDYQGKVVVLDFWATWCTPCRWEASELVELQENYRASGLRVIGISLDDETGPVREFYQRFDLNYSVALGGDPLSDLFGGIVGLPTTFLIGRDGRIHDKHVGARGVDFFEPKVRDLLSATPEVRPPL